MLIMLGYLSDTTCAQLLPTLASNMCMILTGLVAGTTVGPLSMCFACISYASFVPVLVGMHSMFGRIIAATRNCGHPRDVASLQTLYVCTVGIWSLFGVIFALGELQWVDLHTYEMMMSSVDFAAKVIFSNSLLLRNTLSIEIRRWAMMRAIELFSKEKVSGEGTKWRVWGCGVPRARAVRAHPCSLPARVRLACLAHRTLSCSAQPQPLSLRR